ncbi:MAG TPA: NAD(P)-dependent oxidoreductase [Steroidobacteraceae bacterium]|nr:NAD(P)-dependent oxidoreductase [Steroidobacteraceae bacterium]
MKVGFIGLGLMGSAMATRLVQAGHEVMVYNRTAAKLAPLVALGAQPAQSITAVAQHGAVVLSMLADDAALAAVACQPDGLLASLPRGGIHVAMGTHGVAAVEALEQAHRAAGQELVCAPVLGRPEAVTAGRLGVLAAGEATAVARVRPLLESLGRRVFDLGAEPRAAAATKLANNILLACAIEAMGEAFSLVQKCGATPAAFYDVLTDGLFASPAYTIYARIITDQSWDKAGFTVALALKDVELALAAGGRAAVPLPSTDVCRQRLLGAIAHGDIRKDWAAMALEQARACGLA